MSRRIGDCVRIACVWEAAARKVGNVHPNAGFHDLSFTDFVIAAALVADPMEQCRDVGIGRAILSAVESVRLFFKTNPNLGIILLFAPIAAAAGREEPLRQAIELVLEELTVEDARYAYQAIRLARPGGLGEVPEQDVSVEPTINLREAMRLSADRDMIARQYAEGFCDLFEFCLPTLIDSLQRRNNVEEAIIDTQLHFMARFPDSLIVRKCGNAVAEEVRLYAEKVVSLGGIARPEGRREGIELDRYLRSDGNRFNPGTTADLIAASLFMALLEGKMTPDTPFPWKVDDWL